MSETENTLYHGGDVFSFSDKNRERAIRILAPPERTGPLQLGAFLLVLALPLIARSLLRRSRSGARSLRYAVRSIPFVAFGVYGFYESGICAYCDIRVDLLLIAPALLWCVVLFFCSFSNRPAALIPESVDSGGPQSSRRVHMFARTQPVADAEPAVAREGAPWSTSARCTSWSRCSAASSTDAKPTAIPDAGPAQSQAT